MIPPRPLESGLRTFAALAGGQRHGPHARPAGLQQGNHLGQQRLPRSLADGYGKLHFGDDLLLYQGFQGFLDGGGFSR